MSDLSAVFKRQGYIILPQGLTDTEMETLENSSQALYQRAEQLLAEIAASGKTLSEFYQQQSDALIVVPEIDNASKVCRYEYISGSCAPVREQIIPKLQQYIETLAGTPFTLFKDKCNAKNPGGGAFEPHQDVIAYNQFNPQYHITAAIFLDDATLENGCLNFPENYLDDVAGLDSTPMETPVGSLPILASYEGGRNNGNIQQAICEQIRWQSIPARAGDVVLFDSYVPHYSEKNDSQQTRRAMFFTFNALSDGDHYQAYYQMKREQFDNPAFHVATPTAHNRLDD